MMMGGLAPCAHTDSLFDIEPRIEIKNVAHARNVYGDLAQQLVCRTLGCVPIPINGKYPINFDAQLGNVFYEIKSVRRGQKVVLYHWRIEKEKNHIWVQKRKLRYAILLHPVSNAKSVAEYMHQLKEGPVRILNCTGGLIHDLAQHCPLVKPKVREDQPKRFGMTRGGYADGYYNLSVGQLMENTEAVAQFIVPFYSWMIPVELRVS